MKVQHTLMAVGVALALGFQFIAVKYGEVYFLPLFMVGTRFLLMAVCIIPFVKRPTGKWKAIIAIAAIQGWLHLGLFYIGIQHTNASSAAIAYQLGIPFATLLAFAFLGERLKWQGVVGIVLALAGVLIVTKSPSQVGHLGGLLMMVGAAFALAVGNILVKSLGPFDPMVLNGWMAFFSAFMLLATSLILEHGQFHALTSADAPAWAGLIYTAVVGGGIAFGLWYLLLGKYPVSQVVPFSLLTPIFAALASVPFLHEPLTTSLLLGGTLTIFGVAVVQIGSPQQKNHAKIVNEAPE